MATGAIGATISSHAGPTSWALPPTTIVDIGAYEYRGPSAR